MYQCKSPRQLSNQEQSYLARKLGCTVLEVWQVENEERWDYVLRNKENFSEKDFRILEEKGLTLLLAPSQAQQIEQKHDFTKIPAVVVYQRYISNILAPS